MLNKQQPVKNPSSQKYYLKNKEKIRAKHKLYYEQNKEKCRVLQKEWSLDNKERKKETTQKWQEQNKERYQALKNMYKRRLKNQMPPWADKKAILFIYEQAQKTGLTVDHIIPLKGKLVSGLHVESNLRLISAKENSSKRNSYFTGE